MQSKDVTKERTRMNEIKKWVLIQFRKLEAEFDGTYDEALQEKISAQIDSLDEIYAIVKKCTVVELEIIFHKEQGCKVFNLHVEENSSYIEEYEGFCEEDELEIFMEKANLRDITEEITLFDLLGKAIEEKADFN